MAPLTQMPPTYKCWWTLVIPCTGSSQLDKQCFCGAWCPEMVVTCKFTLPREKRFES